MEIAEMAKCHDIQANQNIEIKLQATIPLTVHG